MKYVDWDMVGKSSIIGGVAGAAGGAAGYYMSTSPMLINNVNSPFVRSAIVSPIAAGAGHVAGGTTARWFEGYDLSQAFVHSFDGIGQNMAIGGIIGVASTIGVCYANKINPWTGTPNNYRKPGEYRIWGTQKGLNKEMVDFYYSQMKDGVFDNLRIRVYDYHGELFISDGHCRMTAAFMYYNETGSTYYIELLINNAEKTQLNPADYGIFKNWFLWK